MPSIDIQANLSRRGSGSSCRSFFSPWALWDEEQISAIKLPYDTLNHEVIIISHEVKQVSSSIAHELIQTSPDYIERPNRARQNLTLLLEALQTKNWQAAYNICWQEFQDMHALFLNCSKPFTYINERTKDVLNHLQELWSREGDGPIITMDAGPNIHTLYRPDQTELARRFKQDYLIGNFDVL
jgi:diphosphomevalonate decarboxylase